MMEPTDSKTEEIELNNIQDDNDDWKKRRAVPLVEQKHANRMSNLSSYYTMFDEGHTRILASLVPDEIIYNIADYSKRHFEGCLLFGDVSGFTDLCEKYNKSGKGGPSRLTQVLNNYIGAMVQEILSHSGDVLKFSGDAFIAMWKVTNKLSMRDAVHEAVDCSLMIQKTYGTYQTDVDVVVRVKLAVACGPLVFALIGDNSNSHYLMTGEPIYAIKAAESLSSAGEIVITARVARHLGANEYLLNVFPDGLHAKVLGVGPNWRNVQRQYEEKDTYGPALKDLEESDMTASESSTILSMVLDAEEEEAMTPVVTDQYALRPAVNHAVRIRLKDELKKFIIAPVVRGIDASEPLEYLTEIRQVVILFINCKMASSVGPLEGIDVADRVYVTVCNAVKNQYGCVNKISNFDKDLMLLVIFGLRGFKHDLECQVALKCATICFERINNIEEIDHVAAGVTTGSCYCGAFGHTLRREYTVIGLVVNKAARLMVAYPNRVTCDRETFLYSKLEARNFLLQEYKVLKGIVNPGPIYEFKEVERTHDQGFSISPFPLLGRDQELTLYKNLMNKARELSKKKKDSKHYYSMLVVRGDFRQGKTRLLEEILYLSDPSIPMSPLILTSSAKEISYGAIRLIFLNFIGLPEKTSRSSRQRKIKTRLNNHNVEEFYFIFNYVFDVKFPKTTKLESEEERVEVLTKMFTLLSISCFPRFWVIIMDDIDNIDDESWMLIQILLDLQLVFILATVGSQKELTRYAVEVLKSKRIKTIELKPIDNWYHVGLVCQMLNLDGISPELEKMVQTKSNGNPGWIESFLVTLLQSGGIYVKELTRITAYNIGIVTPPPYMLMRMSQKETDFWMQVMEEQIFSKEDEQSKRWKIFVGSCRESYPDLSAAKHFEEFNKDNVIQVCFIADELNLEDVVPEKPIDVVILQTFDALTSYEQLLLKCSSVLGDAFPRGMLLYIMSSTATRLIALAVQKLFEIQVLSCARGNFLEGGLNFKDRLVDPNEDMSVKCDCTGLMIDESCIDLPKYASCGYIRFRSSEFRETTYNLLTDNQKREFHGKAIRYMEKETRRCRACGSGYFSRWGTGTLDEGLRSKIKMTKYSISSMDSTDTHAEKTSIGGSRISGGKSVMGSFKKDSTSLSSAMDSISLSPDNILVGSRLGFRTIRKLKNNYNLVRTFSAYDFSQCTCTLILSTMYSQLIEHSKGAGLVEKIMDATIEYSYVCLENNNAAQAIKVLEEALVLLDGPMRDQIELEWMISLKKAKLFTLIGRAKMYLDDNDCYQFLKRALRFYGVWFPITNVGKWVLKGYFKLRQGIKFFLYKSAVSRRVDEDLAEYCNNVAECFYLLCKFFISKYKWREAELAAIWSLTRAIQTESNFQIICLAYSCMVYITAMRTSHQLSVALEVYALRICHRKKTLVQYDELKAVSLLYYEIGRARMMRGEIDKAMHMGYPIWRISNAARNLELVFNLFPLLAYGSLLRKQIVEYSDILNELASKAEQDVDQSGKIWYHALCLGLHLDTGFIVETMEMCNQFLQGETFESKIRDTTGPTRLLICKWLWEVRNENWEAATAWQKAAWRYRLLEKGEKLRNLISGLYLLEGLIIFMVHKMDTKNDRVSIKVERMIHMLTKKLWKNSKYCKILQPRLLHLKGYHVMVKTNNYKAAMKRLRKAKRIAEKQHNDLEVSWINHSELAWSNRLHLEERFGWRMQCEEGTCVQINNVDFMEKGAFYSLPLPLYI